MKKKIILFLGMLFPLLSLNAFSKDLNNEIPGYRAPSDSSGSDPFVIPQIKGSFKLDGIVDDPCWTNLYPPPLVMHIPTFGNQPTEKSDVFICHDNEYMSVAVFTTGKPIKSMFLHVCGITLVNRKMVSLFSSTRSTTMRTR